MVCSVEFMTVVCTFNPSVTRPDILRLRYITRIVTNQWPFWGPFPQVTFLLLQLSHRWKMVVECMWG